jgi:hypothetical protein
MKRLIVIFGVLIATLPLYSKNRKDVPLAPLPTVITNAKKVFLTNGGGSNLAYDSFYSEMKKWGKYEIAGSPDEADLIIELAYRVEDGGTRIWSSTNTYNGATQIHSTHRVDPQLVLTIYDAKSKQSVWAAIDHRRLARREKNREKKQLIPLKDLLTSLRVASTRRNSGLLPSLPDAVFDSNASPTGETA